MELFCPAKKPWLQSNLEVFKALMEAYPQVKFRQPQPLLAPWHVQAVINGQTLNFWPHCLKGNVEHSHSVEGISALRSLIEDALEYDDFDLIERTRE